MRYVALMMVVSLMAIGLRGFETYQHGTKANILPPILQFLDPAYAQESNFVPNRNEVPIDTNASDLSPMRIVDDQAPLDETSERENASATQQANRLSNRNGSLNNTLYQPGQRQQLLVDELGKRRQELENREAIIDKKEAMLSAAESQMIERQKALVTLEQKIRTMIEEFESQKSKAQFSIIQTYSVMKPRAAAAIFDQMDIDVLINVVATLKPRKLAEIMAEMNPTKAQELTTSLANIQIVVE